MQTDFEQSLMVYRIVEFEHGVKHLHLDRRSKAEEIPPDTTKRTSLRPHKNQQPSKGPELSAQFQSPEHKG